MTSPVMRTCLWFDHGQARPAAEFYAGLFPDTYVESSFDAPMDYFSGQAGDELTVEFTLLGQPFLGLNGGDGIRPNGAVSFQVYTDTQEQTDRYWNAIVGGGGTENDCGWCFDHWGHAWQITPRALMQGMTNPDREAAKRVMAAMLTMKKIDIAAIERAAAGEFA